MTTLIKNVEIVTPTNVLHRGSCLLEAGYIAYIGQEEPPADRVIDGEGGYLLAGFVDLHCHGGGDDRMLAMLLGESCEDPLGQRASDFDGFTSAMIGIAGNMSIEEGKTIDVKKYIDALR